MIVTLEEAKLYLRVEGNEEDMLITNFIISAEDICEGVLRCPLSTFETVPEIVKQGILFATAQFYELRENINMECVNETLKRLLFAYRLESW